MAEVLVEHPPHADGQTALLYERYGTRIYRFCLSRLRSREEAEDAVQSTFLRAHGSLRQGVVPHSESAWLFKIAQNVCVTRAVASSRRTRLEHAADLEQVHERVPDVHRQHDELIGLGDALAEMPPNLRRPFLLREWKGLSYAEIAEDLGVSQSAVETLIFRARRHLAGALDVTGSRLRRAVKALNLGPVLDLMRALLAGGGAKVAAVAAIATVGAAVGVTALPGSNSRSPGAPAQVTPSGGPGAVPQSTTGGSPGATQSSSDPRSSGPGAAARQGNAAGPAWLRGRLTGTSSPTSSAPWTGTPAGVPPAASPTTGAAPSGNSSAPSGPTAGPPSGSNGAPTVPVVAVPPVPLTPPSGSSGLPEVPVPPLPPLPEVPIPQVPSVPPVPVPQVPPVVPPSVPPLPSLTPPPLPVAPPSVPPIPPVPPLPQPPPVPQVVPPPPPVLPPVPPPPPVLPPVPPPPPLP